MQATGRGQHCGSEGRTESREGRALGKFMTYNNMLDDCYYGVYSEGWMSDREKSVTPGFGGGELDGLMMP